MTREQLDAIRARVDGEYKTALGFDPLQDLHALLAEVERLNELCAAQNATMIDALCAETEAKAKVERLTAERDTAFARGVAAMREAAASHFSVVAPYDYIAPRIRSLPDPEDTE